MYYECHITLETPDYGTEDIKRDIESLAQGWKFSEITGDPILGNRRYCYATKHMKPSMKVQLVISEMNFAALALRMHRWVVVRQKVELVLYDEHTIKLQEQIG